MAQKKSKDIIDVILLIYKEKIYLLLFAIIGLILSYFAPLDKLKVKPLFFATAFIHEVGEHESFENIYFVQKDLSEIAQNKILTQAPIIRSLNPTSAATLHSFYTQLQVSLSEAIEKFIITPNKEYNSLKGDKRQTEIARWYKGLVLANMFEEHGGYKRVKIVLQSRDKKAIEKMLIWALPDAQNKVKNILIKQADLKINILEKAYDNFDKNIEFKNEKIYTQNLINFTQTISDTYAKEDTNLVFYNLKNIAISANPTNKILSSKVGLTSIIIMFSIFLGIIFILSREEIRNRKK